jgi:hypothetical protein
MQKLWEHGVNAQDEYNKKHCNLKSIIFCTINDNPACLALIGQVKGKIACVVCVDLIESSYLPSSSKMVYMRHRIFFPRKDKCHQWKTRFDGTIENDEAPKHRDGKFVFAMIKNINVIFGKSVKGKRGRKLNRLQRTHHLRSSRFSSGTYHIGKSSRLATPLIPCTFRRVSLKVLSVCCWTSQVR